MWIQNNDAIFKVAKLKLSLAICALPSAYHPGPDLKSNDRVVCTQERVWQGPGGKGGWVYSHAWM